MTHRRLLLLLLCCALLAGCSHASSETTVPSSASPVQTMPEPIPTTEATVPPTTEPDLEPGIGVVADGDTLISGSIISEEVTYVRLYELLAALDDLTFTGDEESGYSLTWYGSEYRFQPGHEGLIRDGSTIVLHSPVLTWHSCIWVPVEELCDLMQISLFEDSEQNVLYCTSIPPAWEIPDGINIPILMYHGVTDDTWGYAELFVSPSDMEEQVKYLVENGYDTITFEDFDHLEDFDKPVMLTFDDGYLDNYQELFPILQKYNAKATIFVITYSVDRDERTMTSAQAKEMMDSGLVSIQSHTYNHPWLTECDPGELTRQMELSKLHVTRMTGYEPFVICYPNGDNNADVREAAAKCYDFGLIMSGGLYTTGNADLFQLPRYYVSRSTGMWEFRSMVESAGT